MKRFHSLNRLALACALVVAVVAGTAHSESRRPLDINNYHKPFGKYGPTFSYPSPTRAMNLLNGRPAGQSNRRVAQRPGRPAARLTDLNLSVNMPSGSWEIVDPKEAGSRARYMITRRDPTIIISLAGERAAAGAQRTNSALVAESKEKLKGLGGDVEPGERQLSAAGIHGVAYAASVANGESTAYYAIWVAAHNGYHYKLAVYGDGHDKPMIEAAMLNFVRGLKPLQPTRTAHRTSRNSATTR